MPHPERNYGLGDSTPYVRGVPNVDGPAEGACPNCGCTTTYLIHVSVEHPQLRGGTGKGSYVGCPACPWASPMIMAATPKAPRKES